MVQALRLLRFHSRLTDRLIDSTGLIGPNGADLNVRTRPTFRHFLNYDVNVLGLLATNLTKPVGDLVAASSMRAT